MDGLVSPPMVMPVVPIRMVVRVPAMPAIAIPVARRVGGLRGRNADEEGDRRKGAEDESHRVTSWYELPRQRCGGFKRSRRNQADEQHHFQATVLSGCNKTAPPACAGGAVDASPTVGPITSRDSTVPQRD